MASFSKTAGRMGLGLLASSALLVQAASPPPSPEDLVNALNGVFGKHAGSRASHAKGMCVTGFFHPNTEQALNVTSGPLWSQKRIPVVGRFSVGGGNPKVSDQAQTVRGLSLHIGQTWDLVALSAPVFMVATPEEFIDFMAARQADPATGKPNPERVKAFNAATPSTKPQIDFLSKTRVPASYGQAPYWGVNAFTFTNSDGKTVSGRWTLEPVAGRLGLTPDQLQQMGDDFLETELKKRLEQKPVKFNVLLQLAQQGDDDKNPTVQWPASNPVLLMGELIINKVGGDCTSSMFNPSHLPAGMGMSEDPTLQVRAGAYAVSLGRRLAK